MKSYSLREHFGRVVIMIFGRCTGDARCSQNVSACPPDSEALYLFIGVIFCKLVVLLVAKYFRVVVPNGCLIADPSVLDSAGDLSDSRAEVGETYLGMTRRHTCFGGAASPRASTSFKRSSFAAFLVFFF